MGQEPRRLSPLLCKRGNKPYRSSTCSILTFRLRTSNPTKRSLIFISVFEERDGTIERDDFRGEFAFTFTFVTGRNDSAFQFDVNALSIVSERTHQVFAGREDNTWDVID